MTLHQFFLRTDETAMIFCFLAWFLGRFSSDHEKIDRVPMWIFFPTAALVIVTSIASIWTGS